MEGMELQMDVRLPLLDARPVMHLITDRLTLLLTKPISSQKHALYKPCDTSS